MAANEDPTAGQKRKRSLVALLGLDGPAMRWEAMLVLILAGWLAGALVKIIAALMGAGVLLDWMSWLRLAAFCVLQGVLLAACLRWVKRDLRAAALAAVGLGIVWPVASSLIMFGGFHWALWMALPEVSGLFLQVAGLSLGLRLLKADGPALVVGGALGRGLHLAALGLLGWFGLVPIVDPLWMETAQPGLLHLATASWPQVVAGGIYGLVIWGALRLRPQEP